MKTYRVELTNNVLVSAGEAYSSIGIPDSLYRRARDGVRAPREARREEISEAEGKGAGEG